MTLFGGCLNDTNPLVAWQLLDYAALSPTTVWVPLGQILGSGQYVETDTVAGMEEVLGKCLWENRREEEMAKINCAVLARNRRCLAMIRGGRAIMLPEVFPLQVISSCTFHSGL